MHPGIFTFLFINNILQLEMLNQIKKQKLLLWGIIIILSAIVLSFSFYLFKKISEGKNASKFDKFFNCESLLLGPKLLSDINVLPSLKTSNSKHDKSPVHLVNTIRTKDPIVVEKNEDIIYIPTLSGQIQNDNDCGSSKTGYIQMVADQKNNVSLAPFTYEEMRASLMALGSDGQYLLLTTAPKQLINSALLFRDIDKTPIVIIPFAKDYLSPKGIIENLVYTKALFATGNGNYAFCSYNRISKIWQIDFFGPRLKRLRGPELHKKDRFGFDLAHYFRSERTYPYPILSEKDFEAFLENGNFRYFQDKLLETDLEYFPVSEEPIEIEPLLLKHFFGMFKRAMQAFDQDYKDLRLCPKEQLRPFLKEISADSLQKLTRLIDDISKHDGSNLDSHFLAEYERFTRSINVKKEKIEALIPDLDGKCNTTLLKNLLFDMESFLNISGLEREKRIAKLKKKYWAEINDNSNIEMFFAHDGKGNIYVQSSISPVIRVFDRKGESPFTLYDTDNKDLDCLVKKSSCDSDAAYIHMQSLRRSIWKDLKRIKDIKDKDRFEAKWKTFNGIALNEKGYLIRSRKYKKGKNLIELFSPDKRMLAKDIVVRKDLFVNAGHLDDNFYFLEDLNENDYAKDHQSGYKLYKCKLNDHEQKDN